MPKFRVGGTWSVDFVVEVEAEDMDDAVDLVESFSPGDFDATTHVPTAVDEVIELASDGSEIVTGGEIAVDRVEGDVS